MEIKKINKFLEKSHILIEVVDARMVDECRLKRIEKKYKDKIIIVATKADLIGKDQYQEKIFYVDNKTKKGIAELKEELLEIGNEKLKKYPDQITIFVFGLPNVGKSSLINSLSERKAAKTGFKAGVTKGIQWVKLANKILLIDSPGVIDKNKEIEILGLSASVDAQKIKNPELIAKKIIDMFFEKKKEERLFSFFKVSGKIKKERLVEEIAKRRKLYLKGGELNIEEACRILIREWQRGRLKI